MISLAAFSALALSGCAVGSSGPDATITTNGAEPSRPLLTTDTDELAGIRIIDSLYAGLIFYGADGSPQNDVAASITTNDDNTSVTIVIRDGLTFSDGQPVTSSSFVDAWNFGAQPSNEQANRSAYAPILGFDPAGAADVDLVASGGLTVVDETTFTVTLSAPLADFPLRLGTPAFYPLPPTAFDDIAAFGQHPVGNGPYMLDGDNAWQHDEQIDLVASPTYDGPRDAQNGGVSMIFYPSEAVAYADLLSGNLDVLSTIPDASLASFEDELGDNAVAQPSATLQTITIPATLPHFSGAEGELRREAISRAIDRDEIIDDGLIGPAQPALDFTSPVVDGYLADLSGAEVLQANADSAIDLWSDADQISPWDGQFTIAYSDAAGAATDAWVDAVTAQLANELAIDASGIRVPSDEFDARIADGTIASAFSTSRTGEYPGLYDYLAPAFASQGVANRSGYSNSDFDALLVEAGDAPSLDAADDILQTAQTVLLSELPEIPLWYDATAGGFGDGVSAVTFDWRGVPRYSFIVKPGS